MPLGFDDPIWVMSTEQPVHACAPPYIGNGRLGLRLGALMFGTDPSAPPLTSAAAETCLPGTPRFDHSWPLQSFAAHGRDGFQHCLPSWANIDLRVGGRRFEPSTLQTSSTRPLRTWLDLRTGEAGIDGVWRAHRDPIIVHGRLLIPRSMPHGAFWELSLDELNEPTEIVFGLRGGHLAGDLDQTFRQQGDSIVVSASTRRRQLKMEFGLAWELEGAQAPAEVFSPAPGEVLVRVRAAGTHLKLRVFYSVHGGTENLKPGEALDDLTTLSTGLKSGEIQKQNAGIWRALWLDALDPSTLPIDRPSQQFLLAQQFYLLASYDGSAHPTGPLGLSGNQWGGQMLWDTDLWHAGALDALWPALGMQPVRARLAMLPGAAARAKSLGLPGAWFGWMCDEAGEEQAPGHYQREIHVNAWIARAAWESTGRGKNIAWLREVFPMLAGIADATCGRAERDAEGRWHLRDVLPPDEAVVEDPRNPGKCDDSVSTNLAFATALRAAISAADLLDKPSPPLWGQVASGLVLLEPRADGIVPEYAGYTGHPIKQADLILTFFPLSRPMARDVIAKNLDYYRDRVTWGPLMTEQVETAIRLRLGLGDRPAVLNDFLHRYRRYVRGAFWVPYECVDNSNAIMLTACGGLLQMLIYGWFNQTAVPRIGA